LTVENEQIIKPKIEAYKCNVKINGNEEILFFIDDVGFRQRKRQEEGQPHEREAMEEITNSKQ
jgi:hypothetical protein